MEGVILLVAVLICPVVMGTMMFLMWRGMRQGRDAGGDREARPPGSS